MKRAGIFVIIVSATLLLSLAALAGCTAPVNTVADIAAAEPYGSYKDIPGVTEEEIAAIEGMRNKGIRFSYGQMEETEAFVSPDGSHGGFAVKYCDHLSNLFGMEFVLELYEWDELMSRLDSGALDFTGDLTPTPKRMESYYMTLPIAERSQRIFMLATRVEPMMEQDINGLTIGFLGGTIDADAIREVYPGLKFKSVAVDGFEEAVRMLKSGEIDIFSSEGVIDPFFDKYDFIKSMEFFPLVYTPVSMTTANPDLKDIISVVNKYIAAGGIDSLYDFYMEGAEEYIRFKLEKSFTDEERAYLQNLKENGQSVKIALENDNYPVSFYNVTDKEFQGIAVDVLAEITKLTGIVFESTLTETASWSEIFEMLKTGEVSLVSELIKTEERTGRFLWPDRPYATTYYALMSKSAYPNLSLYQVVRARVGVVSESAYEEKYREWFPDNDNIKPYVTQDGALAALEKDDIDMLMGSEYSLLVQQNFHEKPGYKINIRFGVPVESYFGINNDEETLCSIIDKAQSYIKRGSIGEDWSNRGFDYSKQLAQQRLGFFMALAAACAVVLVLALLLLAKNRRLNKDLDKLVKVRTQELEQQTEAAQAASRAKSVFLATMSHEIKTPLNAITGMARAVGHSPADPDKARKHAGQIQASAQHLLALLNDVLDMAKIESGKLEMSYEPFSPSSAHSEVIAIYEQRCQEKGIRFITNDSDFGDMLLIGDKLRINQILGYLLGNALKYTESGGEVSFILDIAEENEDNITLHFSITDTGIGMTKEQMAKLFVPFEQTDKDVAAKFGGKGLGLSISQNLVGMMGGSIEAFSELGKGSRFSFSLLLPKVGKPSVKALAVEAADYSGKRLLLVDDIEINRAIVTELLASTGIEITEAENGRIAAELFSDSAPGHFDMICMDVQMPEMGGYEATVNIRAMDHPDAKTIPIIAMTANAYKEDVEEALSYGMNGHISKPIDADTVMNTLAKYISG